MEVVYDLATVEFPTGGLKTKNGDIVRCQRGLIVHESFQDSKKTVTLYRMAAEPEYEPGLESRVEPRIERVDPKVDPEFRDQAELPHELRNDIEMLNDRKRMPSHEKRRRILQRASDNLSKQLAAIAAEENHVAHLKRIDAHDPAVLAREARLAVRNRAIQTCPSELQAHRLQLEKDIAAAKKTSAKTRQQNQQNAMLSKKQMKALKKNKINPPTKKTTNKKENNNGKARQEDRVEHAHYGPTYMMSSNRLPLSSKSIPTANGQWQGAFTQADWRQPEDDWRNDVPQWTQERKVEEAAKEEVKVEPTTPIKQEPTNT